MFRKGILVDCKLNMSQLWMWLPKRTIYSQKHYSSAMDSFGNVIVYQLLLRIMLLNV